MIRSVTTHLISGFSLVSQHGIERGVVLVPGFALLPSSKSLRRVFAWLGLALNSLRFASLGLASLGFASLPARCHCVETTRGCARDDDYDDGCSDDCCSDASRWRDGFTAIDVRFTSSSSSSFAVIRGPEDTDASSVDAKIGGNRIGIVVVVVISDWRRTTKTDDDGANASDGDDDGCLCDWCGRVGVVRDDGVRVGVRVGVQSGFVETEARRRDARFRASGALRVVAAHVRPDVCAVWGFAL